MNMALPNLINHSTQKITHSHPQIESDQTHEGLKDTGM